MSSYLTFYLVPKKTKTKYTPEGAVKVQLPDIEPLSFIYYCRSSEVYQAYYENLHPAYCGDDEKYTELTYEDAMLVVKKFEEDVERVRNRLKIDYKILKEGGYSEEVWEDIHSMEEHLSELEETLRDLKYIARLVYSVTEDINDFERVLINID